MAPIDTYWTTNGTGSTKLIEATPGDPVTDPYTILPGSDGVDFTNPQVWVDARLLFEDIVLDPGTGFYPDRPDFDTATFADFTGWHSRHQVDYILEKGTQAYSPDPGLPLPDPLPVGTKTVYYVAFPEGATMVLGQDGRTVYEIESLKLTDIATMPLADQEAFAGLVVFQAQAQALLLRPAVGETLQDVRDGILAQVDALISLVVTSTNYSPTDRDEFLAGFLYDSSLRVRLYPHFFVEELGLYRLRLQNMALFSKARITEFLSDVEARFARIKLYHDVSPETASTSGLIGGVNAFDGGATMANGLGIFVEMESQLFQIALARAYVVATGTMIEPVKGKLMQSQSMVSAVYDTVNSTYKSYATFLADQSTDIYDRLTAGTSKQRILDGPSLIFVLQTFDNYEDEAEAQVKSEEMQQQTAILKDYSRMQELVNETLSVFDPEPNVDDDDAPAETHTLLGLTLVSDLTDAQMRVASMFDKTASAISNTYHPIEGQHSSDFPEDFRPTVEIADSSILNTYEKSVWDSLAVRIGDATKMISQDSQIRMDEISKQNQQKNRHYELGSNVLNKLTDLLRDITS